jgi:hypothetical protein
MSTYLIGYDLNTPGKYYKSLIDAIESLSGTYWHHLDSTWLIHHDGPSTDIRDSLLSHIDSNDELLVVKLTGEGAWKGFNERGNSWLSNNL